MTSSELGKLLFLVWSWIDFQIFARYEFVFIHFWYGRRAGTRISQLRLLRQMSLAIAGSDMLMSIPAFIRSMIHILGLCIGFTSWLISPTCSFQLYQNSILCKNYRTRERESAF